MSPPTISVHIDCLSLLGFEPHQRAAITEAFEAESAKLLADRATQWPSATRSSRSTRARSFPVMAGESAPFLGRRFAPDLAEAVVERLL